MGLEATNAHLFLKKKPTTFNTTGTRDPVYFHWSGLTVVHLFSLYPLFAQLFTLMFCKGETFSLFDSMSKRILIKKR